MTSSALRAAVVSVAPLAMLPVQMNYREDNPVGDAISAVLPTDSVRRQHRKPLPHAQIAEALRRVRASRAHRTA